MTDQQVLSSPTAAIVASWLQSLRKVVDDADQVLEWASTNEITPEETLGVYAELAVLVKALDWQRGELMDLALRGMHDDTHVADFIGGGDLRILRKSASKPRRKWDNEGLLNTVRRKIIARATDSGADENTVSMTINAISDVYRLAGGNVRLAVLRDIEVDADEYCETGDTKFRVEVMS
jgi:hypothetical protein